MEVIAADLRDTSTPDPTGEGGPRRPATVPPPDVTTAVFDRALRLLVDVAARQEAEQAAAAQAGELEPEEASSARNSPASMPTTRTIDGGADEGPALDRTG